MHGLPLSGRAYFGEQSQVSIDFNRGCMGFATSYVDPPEVFYQTYVGPSGWPPSRYMTEVKPDS
jgi:hypothetical protein